jgi:HEAT repeat protein
MTDAPKSRAAWASAVSVALSLTLVLHAGVGSIAAQDRTTVIRVLEEGHDFRARVRAARALGSSGDPAMADHLVRALADESAAVRAAAAEGLGRLANPSSLTALRRATHDAEAEVREAAERAIRTLSAATPAPPSTPSPAPSPARPPSIAVLPPSRAIDWRTTNYVVLLGSLVNGSGFTHAPLESVLRQEVNRALVVLRGVAVLSATDPHADADREIAARHLPQYRLEGTIRAVRPATHGRDLQVRCEVALVLTEEPSHNIRAALNGAATGTEPLGGARAVRERALAEQALQSATRSAMSGAARAITSHH